MKHYFRIVVLANGNESPGDTQYASFAEALAARHVLLDEARKTNPKAIVAIDEYCGKEKQVRLVPTMERA